jgi:serine/threonine protein kinase/Tol biopolymer transport system component
VDDLIGRKIGGYEVIELIGHGGMATVYRARQISMNRIVAVKVLPRQFMNDETYMQRFTREVRIASELEHRNIVPVHDYGEDDGQPYIVMRYMPGGSIDDLLREGALNLDQIVSIVGQIAPALDFAHSKNVLHRDLKPSNVLMDDNGGAYLTDFGIARLMSDINQVTLTTKGVVGTPSYMSPEQAQGQPLDNRSDIYSLGVMLFEMATGQRPFESETPYGIAVLQVTAQPPSPRSLNHTVPTPVENVILTTMSKKREGRYSSAIQLSEALKIAAETAESAALSDTQPGYPRPPEQSYAEPVSTPPPPQQSAVYTTPPPSSPYIAPVSGTLPPVAKRRSLRPKRGGNLLVSLALGGVLGCGLLALVALVIAVVANGIANLTLDPTAEIPGGIVTPLPATETLSPFDVVNASATPVAGEPTSTAATPEVVDVTELVPVGQRDTPAPLADGTIVYFAERDNNFDIYLMNLTTRVEQRLTTPATNELYPSVSPDGQWIAFMSDQGGDYDIYVMDINGRDTRRLTENSVTDRVPAWSSDSEWIAFSSDTRGDGAHDLYRVRADGTDLQEWVSNGMRLGYPRWSADDRYIVFTGGSVSDASTWEIWRLDLQTDELIALTDNSVKDWAPVFVPDGSLLYATEGEGHAAIARMDIDGSNARVLYDTDAYEWGMSTSPDGSRITFTSDASGRDEVYLMTDDAQDVRVVTELGGMDAAWLP